MHKKILLLVLLILTFIAVYAVARDEDYNYTNDVNLPAKATVDYAPPSDEEAQTGNKKKTEIVETTETQIPDTAKIAIVDASQYDDIIEVRAFVSNIVENGTCKFTFIQGDHKIIKNTPAIADASTTPCTNLTIPISELPANGTWVLTVTYSNGKITGSASSTIKVK